MKPRARTDRYSILAALYCLAANRTPVPTDEVVQFLRTHLGQKAPKKVSTRLREYTADVEISGLNPTRWRLTAKGLETLSALSGLGFTADRQSTAYGAAVGIICALETPEFTAVMAASGGEAKWKELENPSIPHRYRETTITTTHGRDLRVVGTTSMSMGLTTAAIVTTQMVMLHRPRLVLMMGIAPAPKPKFLSLCNRRHG